jgi:hypothetical protein
MSLYILPKIYITIFGTLVESNRTCINADTLSQLLLGETEEGHEPLVSRPVPATTAHTTHYIPLSQPAYIPDQLLKRVRPSHQMGAEYP